MSSIKEIGRPFGVAEVERWSMDWHRNRPRIDPDGTVSPGAAVSASALPVANGAVIRIAMERGTTADIFLTVSAALMLAQTIEAAGRAGGWLDDKGEIVTSAAPPPAPGAGRQS